MLVTMRRYRHTTSDWKDTYYEYITDEKAFLGRERGFLGSKAKGRATLPWDSVLVKGPKLTDSESFHS